MKTDKTENINKNVIKKQSTLGKKAMNKVIVNYAAGDFLIRVKNAAKAGKKEVSAPATRLVLAVAKVLETEGYLNDVKSLDGTVSAGVARYAKESRLLGLTLISRPGLRRYVTTRELAAMRGPEVYVISTSQGVISSKEAIKKSLGGELLAKVW